MASVLCESKCSVPVRIFQCNSVSLWFVGSAWQMSATDCFIFNILPFKNVLGLRGLRAAFLTAVPGSALNLQPNCPLDVRLLGHLQCLFYS